MSIGTGGPALDPKGDSADGYPYPSEGLTARDYFAAKAMQVVLDKLHIVGLYQEEMPGDSLLVAQAAYKLADAMLAARDMGREG